MLPGSSPWKSHHLREVRRQGDVAVHLEEAPARHDARKYRTEAASVSPPPVTAPTRAAAVAQEAAQRRKRRAVSLSPMPQGARTDVVSIVDLSGWVFQPWGTGSPALHCLDPMGEGRRVGCKDSPCNAVVVLLTE